MKIIILLLLFPICVSSQIFHAISGNDTIKGNVKSITSKDYKVIEEGNNHSTDIIYAKGDPVDGYNLMTIIKYNENGNTISFSMFNRNNNKLEGGSTFFYNANGLLTSNVSHYSGLDKKKSKSVTNYVYNENQKCIKQTDLQRKSNGKEKVLEEIVINYDEDGKFLNSTKEENGKLEKINAIYLVNNESRTKSYIEFDSNGDTIILYKYNFNGGLLLYRNWKKKGKVQFERILTYNENQDLKTLNYLSICPNVEATGMCRYKSSYIYLAFDKFNNWTQRIEITKVNYSTKKILEERIITYYE